MSSRTSGQRGIPEYLNYGTDHTPAADPKLSSPSCRNLVRLERPVHQPRSVDTVKSATDPPAWRESLQPVRALKQANLGVENSQARIPTRARRPQKAIHHSSSLPAATRRHACQRPFLKKSCWWGSATRRDTGPCNGQTFASVRTGAVLAPRHDLRRGRVRLPAAEHAGACRHSSRHAVGRRKTVVAKSRALLRSFWRSTNSRRAHTVSATDASNESSCMTAYMGSLPATFVTTLDSQPDGTRPTRRRIRGRQRRRAGCRSSASPHHRPLRYFPSRN